MQDVDGSVWMHDKDTVWVCLLGGPRCHLVFSLALGRTGEGGATQTGRWGQDGGVTTNSWEVGQTGGTLEATQCGSRCAALPAGTASTLVRR